MIIECELLMWVSEIDVVVTVISIALKIQEPVTYTDTTIIKSE